MLVKKSRKIFRMNAFPFNMAKEKIIITLFAITLPFLLIILSYKLSLFFILLTLPQQQTIEFFYEKNGLTLNYTSREISHLKDVQDIMKKTDIIFYFLLFAYSLLLTISRKNKPRLQKLFFIGGSLTLLLILIPLFFLLFQFNTLFTFFHQLFFPQGNWVFPLDSLLIKTFPLNFFTKISALIFIQTVVYGFIFLLLSSALKKKPFSPNQ